MLTFIVRIIHEPSCRESQAFDSYAIIKS